MIVKGTLRGCLFDYDLMKDTTDFIESAIDSLEQSPNTGFILIAAKFGFPDCWLAGHMRTREQCKWVRRRFEELMEKLEAGLQGDTQSR